MAFEGLICPACSNQLDEVMLEEKMVCPHCSTNLKQKIPMVILTGGMDLLILIKEPDISTELKKLKKYRV